MYAQRILVLAVLAVSASGQFQIAPERSKRLELALDEALATQTLPCDAEPTRPFLDFAFRFEIGYLVHCPLKEFGGVETPIAAYIRVQPADGTPAWFSESYRIPGIPSDLRSKFNLQRDRKDVEFSGVIASGEGEYSVELVVVDKQHRLFHRRWKTKVYAHGSETKAPVSIQPNTVEALTFPAWEHPVSERNLNRLAVLIDAVPMRADSTRLRAWDRAFLIEALSSVLKLLPSNSVRLVAFNLDQQREVFRSDDFNSHEEQRFSRALDELQLGKVSYQVLQQSQNVSSMLLELLENEVKAKDAADAIVVLGPTNRVSDKIPPELAASRRPGSPPIFYLKYSPISTGRFRMPFSTIMGMREDFTHDLANLEVGGNGEFPDIVQRAAALHDGVTINLHSPADLADALRKIHRKLRPGAQSSAE
ncbi:MAG TPA: hypothetical protein VFA65_00045 [Bryobacteraceae bacterium]|nr:hypothetical protein [Bryobacteraceae bacterium]